MFVRLVVILVLTLAAAGATGGFAPNNWRHRRRPQRVTGKTSSRGSTSMFMEMISQEQADQLVNKWVHAWNSHDLEDLMSSDFFSDDVQYTSPFIAKLTDNPNGTLHGKDTVKNYFQTVLNKYPNIIFVPQNAVPGLSSVAIRYSSRSSNFSDFACELPVMEVDPASGKVKRVTTHSVFKKQQGEIKIGDDSAYTKPKRGTTSDSNLMAQEQADQFANGWLKAWNSHDLDAIMSHFADNVEFVSPKVVEFLPNKHSDGIIHGKQALVDYFQSALHKIPDLNFELYQVYPGLSTVVVCYKSVNNLMACEVFELDPGNGGKVKRVVNHYARYLWVPRRTTLGSPFISSFKGI